MAAFDTPTDIGNRALQRCGAELMDDTLGFAEDSVNARAVSFCYDMLRRAELQANTWKFATKRAILRPVDTNTMLLSPALWMSSTTYFDGSMVSDANGNLWISQAPNNLNNDPLATTLWAPYFGPLAVDPYNSTLAYAAGEVVYIAPGDGTCNVYLSTANNNGVDPSLPNQWSSATVYFKDDVVQSFPAYASGTTYSQGQGVLYTDGNVYASLINSNTGNAPNAAGSTAWVQVPTLTLPFAPGAPTSSPVVEWLAATIYAVGNVVMFSGTEYLSIAANNTGNLPNASGSTSWVAITGGPLYMSLIDLNAGNAPAGAPALFNIATTYATGNTVGGSDGVIYKSLSNGNVGHDPTTDAGVHWQNTGVLNPWTTVFTLGGGNSNWLQIGGAAFPGGVGLSELNIVYPLGSGPASQDATRNIFKLPASFMRSCSQDPKAGSLSYLGAPSGLAYKDWLFESGFIVSREIDPLMLRFVADVTDVTQMDDMFCEGLARRVALEVCEKVTGSGAKVDQIGKEYEHFMDRAKTANAIEVGSEEPPVDDWLACRL